MVVTEWGATFEYAKYDQITAYNHAMTAFYGMNAYLYIADVDEFLIVPRLIDPPRIHNTIMQGMWH